MKLLLKSESNLSSHVMKSKRAGITLAAALLLWLPRLKGVTVTDEELTEHRDWVAARFEGRPPPPRTDPALVVLANHGPVLKNARAGKPLRIAAQDFTRGLLGHAPSKILIRLPAPGGSFTAIVGIDSNEQTSGGRGSVDFSVSAGGPERFRSGVLREGMAGKLNAAIMAYKLSCLRIDYNIDPLAFWRFMDAKDPDRVGLTEMRYVEGLYQMWDDLLKANPGLFIDNCASGGRRIDLETMSRSIPLWRSDNTCDMLDLKPATVLSAARKNQLMSLGLNRYVPFSTVGQMGATPYLFRSGFNGGVAFAEDVRPKQYRRDLLKQGIAEGKRLRKCFLGDFYPLVDAGADPHGWMVTQYHRPRENDGMVMAFRRDQSAYVACEGRLREIDPRKKYEVIIYRTYEPEKSVTLKGSTLRQLRLEIGESPGSVIVEYRDAAAPKERSP